MSGWHKLMSLYDNLAVWGYTGRKQPAISARALLYNRERFGMRWSVRFPMRLISSLQQCPANVPSQSKANLLSVQNKLGRLVIALIVRYAGINPNNGIIFLTH